MVQIASQVVYDARTKVAREDDYDGNVYPFLRLRIDSFQRSKKKMYHRSYSNVTL